LPGTSATQVDVKDFDGFLDYNRYNIISDEKLSLVLIGKEYLGQQIWETHGDNIKEKLRMMVEDKLSE